MVEVVEAAAVVLEAVLSAVARRSGWVEAWEAVAAEVACTADDAALLAVAAEDAAVLAAPAEERVTGAAAAEVYVAAVEAPVPDSS